MVSVSVTLLVTMESRAPLLSRFKAVQMERTLSISLHLMTRMIGCPEENQLISGPL